MNKTEELVRYLRMYGPTPVTVLAKHLDQSNDTVARKLRALQLNNRYGVVRAGSSRSGTRTIGVWAINKDEFNKYLKDKSEIMARVWKDRETEKVKNRQRKQLIEEGHTGYLYSGPILTIWQKSSPYYQPRKKRA